jgi:hypothetical protein
MFITKKHLSRRTFLRGAGVAVGLPLLEAMIPASTALSQTAAKPMPRMGFIYFPHGAIMDRWTPATEGRDFEISPILKPLEKFKKQLTIVSGLENKAAIAPPVHALSPGTWLSGWPAKEPGALRRSHVDQMAAQHLGQDTPFPSLELCIEARAAAAPAIASTAAAMPAPRVPHAVNAAADGERSAQTLPALFRQGDTPQERKNIARSIRACWIWFPKKPPICSAVSARAIAPCWATISKAFAKSKDACRRWKPATSLNSSCPTHRPAFPERLTHTLI